MSKLTAIKVRNAKPAEKAYRLSDGHGMHLHVSKTGNKTWRYRFEIQGNESTFVLGEYPQMSLEDARTARMHARQLVKNGVNPAEARREEKQAVSDENNGITFKDVAFEWIGKQTDGWSESHLKAVKGSLESDVYPEIGDCPIENITTPRLVDMMSKVEKRGALETARKVLQRVNSIFMYAERTGKVPKNPAASIKGSLKTRKVIHHAALKKEDIPQFLKDLEDKKLHITTRLGLKFLILTAARTDEIRKAVWREIDMDDLMWRIPAERMKMGSAHNVPLSKQALQIIDQIGRIFGKTGYIFPSIRDYEKPMSQNTMLYAMHSLGYHGKGTVHGFRATFSTICNEEGFNGDVIEKALAHVERNRVRAAYHRSEYIEKRRELMQWWADYLDNLKLNNGK